ncbi:2-hydroxymuconate semialdehyde hydrolase [Nocardia cerradoensis]|uniref:2-hydroxymuconate semialdehyde hydrolase n=1 Tax=Nocardia cerradoensis TaxID=85688 RepID=A0A231H4D7_9NOCA|nr:alpha/beta hydrolase [Nocardia cerradoensis]OXR43652.1 2-hydroxymuconate semialdehyde hydrolase [Nocardia cerradoensis]
MPTSDVIDSTQAPSPSPEIGKTIDVAGVATNYHDLGTGDPVLLIHGSGPGVSAWANWRLTIPALAQRHRVIAPDILGFGYTQRPGGAAYNAETWLEHLGGLLDALGLDRVSVVGNSFGGALALRLATRFPHRVHRLVLMGSVGVLFPITPGLDAVWGYEPSVPAMRHLLGVFAYDPKYATDELAELRYRASVRPGVHESYAAMFPEPRQHKVAEMAVSEHEIAELQHQTLIVHGRDDQVIPLSNSHRLLDLIPNSQLHAFARCGHWVQIEHTERFNTLVDSFLSGLL